MSTYDVIVIGGGPGGYLAAELIGKAGLTCLLFEKKSVGGVCLNEGCIPTKSFLNSAKIFEHASSGNSVGVDCTGIKLDHASAVEHKNETVKTLVHGVESTLRKNKIAVVHEEAEISGKDGNDFILKAGSESYACRNLVIASGSEPVIPPIGGLKSLRNSGKILTSREILDLKEVPVELVVIGGGVIGLEMASYFSTAGSHVSIIEMEDKIAGKLDEEISMLLKDELTNKGISFYLGSRVTAINDETVCFSGKDFEKKIPYTKLLLSTGRKPCSVKGIESIGIKTNNSGILIDDICSTNVKGVYAVGDVTGKIMLAHVAYRQAEVVVHHLLGEKDLIDYTAVPSVIYTQPETGWVGLSEAEASEQGYKYKVYKASMNSSGRHVAENGIVKGICKLIVDDKKGIIIGGGLIGSYASEVIYSLVLMINNKIPVESIKKTIFPHPTVCEVIKEALRA